MLIKLTFIRRILRFHDFLALNVISNHLKKENIPVSIYLSADRLIFCLELFLLLLHLFMHPPINNFFLLVFSRLKIRKKYLFFLNHTFQKFKFINFFLLFYGKFFKCFFFRKSLIFDYF